MKRIFNMRVAILGVGFISISFLITGCDKAINTQPASTIPPLVFPTSESTNSVTQTPINDSSPIDVTQTLSAAPTSENDYFDPTLYTFTLEIDYDAHFIDVSQTITYMNSTGKDILEIPLWFPAAYYPGVIELKQYTSDLAAELILPVESDLPWVIRVDSPLNTGAIINLSIDYSIILPFQNGPLGYTAQQMNLFNWYPFIPPYDQENGWVTNPYSSIGEYVVSEKADFHVKIHLSGNDKVVIAAAGNEVTTGEAFSFSHLNARDFALSISPHFQKLSQTMGDVTINAYVLPGDENAGSELVRNTAAAMLYYETLYDMKYPHSTLTIIDADFPDGMESDGLYFLSSDYLGAYDGTHRNYMTILSAHETAHQWFYGIVGNNQATEPWLDESMCTLSEILYYEEFYPSDVDWWWDYRVNSYDPQGKIDITVYQATALRPYINSVYLQGVRFLDELRTTAGDEYFLTNLKNYIRENAGHIASREDFFSLFEPFDLSELISTYFSR